MTYRSHTWDQFQFCARCKVARKDGHKTECGEKYVPLYITEVDTNIKKASGPSTFNKPRVLISGKNGSGKTARLNGIMLALVGEANDVVGRDSVRTSALLRELDSEGLVHAKVTLSDGSEALWSLAQGGRPKHSPLPCAVHFPLQEALDAISGSRAVTLRYLYKSFGPEDWVIARSGRPTRSVGSFGPEDWAEVLTKEKQARAHASSAKKVVRSIQGVLDRLHCGAPLTASSDIIRAVGTLTRHQLDKGHSKCCVCGEKPDAGVFQARYDRVSPRLSELSAITSEGAQGLLTAQGEARLLAQRHEAIAAECMGTIERWFQARRLHLETVITGSPRGPLGHIGIKDSKSYVLIGRKEEDVVWPVVSGAESILLAMTLAKAARKEAGLNLAIVPDRAFDTKTFKALLHLISDTPDINAFVQSVIIPRAAPADWSTLHLKE